MKTKYYSLYANAVDSKGDTHVVTVVGELITGKQRMDYEIETPITYNDKKLPKNGTLTFERRVLYRKLTVGIAICNPSDTFDEEYGIELAKSRIKKGFDAGILETNSVTMLTPDQVYAQLYAKLKWVCDHIDNYLPEETKENNDDDDAIETANDEIADEGENISDDFVFGDFEADETDEINCGGLFLNFP